MPRVTFSRLTIFALLCASPAWAQERRELTFSLGSAQGALVMEVEYLDPAEFDARLEGSQVWPVRVSVRNDSEQPKRFGARDLRLSVGGGEALTPVSPVEIADEVLARRTGPLSAFLR